jgi:hypothetical protein
MFGRSNLETRKNHQRLLLAAGIAVLFSGSLQASLTPGTILGVFSDPVLQGSVSNDPSLGASTYFDNTGTANFSINNSTNPATTGSALVWGGTPSASILEFFGAPMPSSPDTTFQIGTITFSNGTSALISLIFGATLSFYDNSISPANFLGSDQVIITTTTNFGQSAAQDSDYINICGNQSNICAQSINAVENGNGVTVALTGKIVGDPQLFIDSVDLAFPQDPDTAGFVGSNPPIGVAPEPGTLLMIPGAFLMAGLLWRRRAA